MDPDREGVLAGPFHDGQQLDRVSEALGELHVDGPDRGDPLAHHIGAGHVVPEGHTGQDGRLGRRVVPFDVRGRVALGQAQGLGLGQHIGVVGALLAHLGQDEVGGAVHDAHHPLDPLAGQRLAQRPDQGDGAGHGRLVEQVDALVLGQRAQGDTLGGGQEGLVGGDHRLAGLQRLLDQLPGGHEAPDELHHHVHRGVRDQAGGVRGEQADGDVLGPGQGQVVDGDAGDLQPGPALDGQRLGPVLEDPDQGRSHVPASEHGDAHHAVGRGGRGHQVTLPPGRPGTRRPPVDQTSSRTRSSKVSRRTTVRASPSATKTTAGRGTLL
jgi:hypothetical protein